MQGWPCLHNKPLDLWHIVSYTLCLQTSNLHPVATDFVTAHDMLPDLVWSHGQARFAQGRSCTVLCKECCDSAVAMSDRQTDRLSAGHKSSPPIALYALLEQGTTSTGTGCNRDKYGSTWHARVSPCTYTSKKHNCRRCRECTCTE